MGNGANNASASRHRAVFVSLHIQNRTWRHVTCSRSEGCGERWTERGNVKAALRSVFHSILFHSQSWVRKIRSRRRSTYCLSFSLREGEETTAHSFPFMSLFLLGSQVHWEARADAGIRLEIWEEKGFRHSKDLHKSWYVV